MLDAASVPVERPWHVVAVGDDAGGRPVVFVSHHLLAQARTPATANAAGDTNAPDPGNVPAQPWMIGGGFAWSIDIFESAGGRRYIPLTVSWTRAVTREGGPGWLRGRLLWGVEAMPLYAQHAPFRTVGAGVSPLLWRWEFVPRRRAAPFAEMAFGGLFTRDPVPEGTTRTNFVAHGTFGVRWRPAARVSPVTAYRFQHVSNGNAQRQNPGVNAHVLWVGVAVGGR